MPSAGLITVGQTVELLDGPFATVASNVAAGRYVLWLGSGISRDRAPDLSSLIKKVLTFLQERLDPANPGCAYRAALDEAIDDIAQLPSVDKSSIDFSQPPESWPVIDRLVLGLTDRYADLLDIRVNGHPRDYLVWEAVDVRDTYGVDLPPDCEHLCVAILAAEGAVDQIASANWDGMIEAALVEILGDLEPLSRVAVVAEDLRGGEAPILLLKFHGCAVRARLDPARWRETIVGRRSQIQRWMTDSATKPIFDKLISLASTRPTLMIGMSAQDQNIQQLFNAAQAEISWPWPASSPDPPAYVFAEDRLGINQKTILRVVYGDDYDGQPQAVEAEALLRAYAKALLLALVLVTVRTKLTAFLTAVDAPALDAAGRIELADGVASLVAALADCAEPYRLEFVRTALQHERRAMTLFRTGSEPAVDAPAYVRISAEPARLAQTSPDLVVNGVRELAAALALLGRGMASGRWSIDTGGEGALTVRKGPLQTAVYFAANGRAEVELWKSGLLDDSRPDAILIQSTDASIASPRSPSGGYGRTGSSSPRRVEMAELLRHASSLDELEEQFQHEAVL